MLKALLVWVLATGGASSGGAEAVAYYVSTTGSDKNPGTMEMPWRTIGHANEELRAGDTVYVREGVYDEYIEPARSGEEGAPITYAAYPGEEVTLQGQSEVARLVRLVEKDHIVVEGFVISYGHDPPIGDPESGDGGKRWQWVLISRGNQNVIRDCTVRRDGDPLDLHRAGYREFGIVVNAGYDNLVEDNVIRGLSVGVIAKGGAQRTIIRGNTISETGKSGIVVDAAPGVVQGLLIEGNVIERSATEDGIQMQHRPDLYDIPIVCQGIVIRNNVIRYNNENAIDLKGTADTIIEGNVIYGTVGSNNGPLDGWNRDSMGAILRGSGAISRNCVIRHNVIYDNPRAIWAFEGYKVYNNTILGNNRDYTGPNSDFEANSQVPFTGIWSYGMSRVGIQNNIMAGHRQGEMILAFDQTEGGDSHIDYNLYCNVSGVYLGRKVGDQILRYRLSEWQALLRGLEKLEGDEEHSLVGNPQFVDAPKGPVGEHDQFDFHLQAGSSAIDRGGPLTRVQGTGSGRTLVVGDARYFFDGYGVTDGDLIRIGANSPVRIESIDYDNNAITVDRAVTWETGDWVNLPYGGTAPDIGAYACVGGCLPAMLSGSQIRDVCEW